MFFYIRHQNQSSHSRMPQSVRPLFALACLALIPIGCSSEPAATAPVADFSLSATPAAGALTAGVDSPQVSATTTGINGFNASVAVALSGLPAGITAKPASFILNPGAPQTITLTAAPTVPASSNTITLIGTSGSISHTTSFTLKVTAAPPPDFSITVAPTSLSLTTGASGQQATLTAVGTNGFNGAISISLSALPVGVTAAPSTLSLTSGAPQSITFSAAADATIGASTINIQGQSGSLSHSASLSITVAVPTGNDAVTYHYDNARTGLNLDETILTPANVNSSTFGKINLLSVDGKVDAEPLYLSDVTISGQTHNVLYVVTEHGSIYAFDADNGAQLWKVSALGSAETTSDNHGCSDFTPEIGITSTPVIDRRRGTNGAIFIVAMSKDFEWWIPSTSPCSRHHYGS